jgi:hypothetical protein
MDFINLMDEKYAPFYEIAFTLGLFILRLSALNKRYKNAMGVRNIRKTVDNKILGRIQSLLQVSFCVDYYLDPSE